MNALKTIQRHCAYCLRKCKVIKCSSCRRRAYCSKLCQTQDWAPGKGGQGHKLWCSRFCGEEDMDWEVRAAADWAKGLGVFALRDLPRFTRIIVDGERADDHPAIDDLLPAGGSRKDKFELNSLMVEEQGQQGQTKKTVTLYLRVARVNHSCSPNAFTCPDFSTHSTTILADRDISAGEEITIAYMAFNEPIAFIPRIEVIRYLISEHGIRCPEGCFCQDPWMADQCAEVGEEFAKLQQLWMCCSGPIKTYRREALCDQAMALTARLLRSLRVIKALYRSRLTVICGTVAMIVSHPGDGRHLQCVGEYLKEACAFAAAAYTPSGEMMQRMLGLQQEYTEVVAMLR